MSKEPNLYIKRGKKMIHVSKVTWEDLVAENSTVPSDIPMHLLPEKTRIKIEKYKP